MENPSAHLNPREIPEFSKTLTNMYLETKLVMLSVYFYNVHTCLIDLEALEKLSLKIKI